MAEVQKQPQAATHQDLANAIRFLAIDAVQAANSGHPGAPMGMADVVTVLYKHFLNYDPSHPNWAGRDRFVLSNGHGSMVLYALLHLTGYDLSLDEIKHFRQLNSKTPGHPEFGHTPGVETTTGPLGQGFANAVGMAVGHKMLASRFGAELFSNNIYVSVGDGCLMEGISHEAAELAGHLKLNNLIVMFDDNGISIDGETNLAVSSDMQARFQAYGFETLQADGHDETAIYKAFEQAQDCDKPVFISFKTQIGFGSPSKANTSGIHGSPLGDEEIANTRKNLGWSWPPFEVPDFIRHGWSMAAEHGKRHTETWYKTFNALPTDKKTEIEAFLNRRLPKNLTDITRAIKTEVSKTKPKVATRKASGQVLEELGKAVPQLVSGSADLTGSVNTRTHSLHNALTADDFSGRYIFYGVREHAMGAMMNGLSLSGFIPSGGTFLTFADYMREPIRLSAMMNQGVVYVLTHDSIGLGEDGPTHQPVEHLAMLRATPNLNVMRPADLTETAECWQLALENADTPTAMVLTRQGLPTVRTAYEADNLCAKGGYVLCKEQGELQGVFIATGSEVHVAVEAHKKLAEDGVHTRVVSLPCWELFDAQNQNYKDSVLPPKTPARVAIEAASPMGWERYTGSCGTILAMTTFGASAPAEDLFKHFGLTVRDAVNAMKELTK